MKRKKYKTYHSGVKVCYSFGLQKELLPKDFIQTIPSSTSFYWKQDVSEKYLGAEYISNIEQNLENIQLIFNEKLRQYTHVYFKICRLYILLLQWIGKKNFKTFIKSNRREVIEILDKLPIDEDRKKLAQFFRINLKTYHSWKYLQKHSCGNSLIKLCFKRFPHQISKIEIKVLKKFMQNKNFKHWSVASIWGKAFKEKKISMSRSSWYNYSKKLGLYSTREKRTKAKRKSGSVKATRPNEIYHMDVTHIKTFDNVKYYVYTVVDNYSRKIIAHTISRKLSGKIRLESLKTAIEKIFGVNLSKKDFEESNNPNLNLELIVDGGIENNNFVIHDFIKNCHINIDKKIALKDVTFSNSVIEGTYRIMKSSYFRNKQILSTTIEQEIEFFVNDYNNNRPHYIHKIYTPDEIFNNPELKDNIPHLSRVNKKRISDNRKYCCRDSV